MRTLVTVPVYNGDKFIARTLDSCVRQTTPCAIYVVDNKSTDRTIEIVKSYQKTYKNIELIQNNENLGRVGNWNRCLDCFELSSYEFLKFVFCGDELLQNSVSETELIFDSFPELAAVAHPYEFRDLNGNSSIAAHPEYFDKYFSPEELSVVNFTKGGLLGAIICNTYSRHAIQGIRLDTKLLGKAEFDLSVLLGRSAYYSSKTLSIFNQDCHNTYAKSLCAYTGVEAAFSEMRVLFNNKMTFNDDSYVHFEQAILRNIWTYTYTYMNDETISWFHMKALSEKKKRTKRYFLLSRSWYKNVLKRLALRIIKR